jgi:hypothetical protein
MPALTDPAALAAEFNALHPIDTPVHYWLTVRHGDPRSGRTASVALPRGQHHSRPVVLVAGDDGDLGIVPLSLVEPIRGRVVDPCDLCGHPKAGHGVRYKALHGEHEWCDPYGRLITDTATKPAARPEPRPAAVDPYQPVPDPETRRAWADEPRSDHQRPTVLARIYNAAKKEGTNR